MTYTVRQSGHVVTTGDGDTGGDGEARVCGRVQAPTVKVRIRSTSSVNHGGHGHNGPLRIGSHRSLYFNDCPLANVRR